jgi:hypothetical protein
MEDGVRDYYGKVVQVLWASHMSSSLTVGDSWEHGERKGEHVLWDPDSWWRGHGDDFLCRRSVDYTTQTA